MTPVANAKKSSSKPPRLANEYVPALTNMGIALAKQDQLKEAEQYFQSALVLEPEKRNVLLNLAILFEKQKTYEDAADYYTRLMGLGSIDGMLGRARIYEKQGEVREAMKIYKNAFSLESIDEKTRSRIRQRISRLKNN